MRDIKFYQENYEDIPYEYYQIMLRKKKVLHEIRKYKHDLVIEIGCGLDSIMNDFDEFQHLVVIEPGGMFFNKAVTDREHLKYKDRISLVNTFFEIWQPKGGQKSPDFILVSSLLHEVEKPEIILNKLHEIAGRGTIIHINIPNAKSFHRLLAVEMGLIKNEFEKSESQIKFHQNNVLDYGKLCKLVENCGFKVIEGGSFSFKPFTHGQMEKIINAGIITKEVIEGLYKMEKYVPDLGSEIYVNIQKNN